MGDLSDAELLAAFRAGDSRAFEALVRRYQRPALAIARGFARFDRSEEAQEHEAEPTIEDPEGRIARVQQQKALGEAVARLPRRQREVLLLRIDGDLPFAEIAQTLGITEVNAKVNFHHAVQKLKQLVQG